VRRRRVFRLEGLEERKLLSHKGITAEVRAAAATTSTPANHIQAKVIGTMASAALLSGNLTGFTGLSGRGVATHLGAILFGTQFSATPGHTVPTTFDINQGAAVLTSNIGDQIDLAFTGSAVTNVTRSHNATINFFGIVNSGTNRFDGFTGTFSATGQLDFKTDRFILGLAIDVVPPG
jgi:hypothetical protein